MSYFYHIITLYMKKKVFVLIMFSIALSGCFIFKHHTNTTNIQNIELEPIEVTAKKNVPTYHPTTTKVWEILNTKIALSFNLAEKTANVTENITAHPYFYSTDTICLDAKGIKIELVQLVLPSGNKDLKYIYENDILKIYLGKQYDRSNNIELFFKYTAMPYSNSTGGGGAISDDRGLYFINTDNKIPGKPVEIWTQGECESNSHWMITIDKPNTRFTTHIELTVPDTFTTLSNGELIEQRKIDKGFRTDIWKMDMPIQTYVVMFAIGKFSIIKDSWHGKEVNYFVEPAFATNAKQIFKNSTEMLDCYSEKTGVPFPWNKYDQVIVRDYVSGAMENTTAALFGEFMNRNSREMLDNDGEDVVAHELFHEWFGDYVTCESWGNLTLNESFANFGEQIWRNYKYGKASADELAYNDLERYISSSKYNDRQLVTFKYNKYDDMFDGISYNKGGAILRYINSIAGDDAFNLAMKIYLTKNALHSAEAHQWRMAIEESTGQDWNLFFNQWYYHGGHPILSVDYIADKSNVPNSQKKLMVVVKQIQPDSGFVYTLPLKTAIFYGKNKTLVDWNINKITDTFYYNYNNGEMPIVVPDFEHVLPGEIIENKQPEEWLKQFNYCSDYIGKRLAINAAVENLADTFMQQIIDNALLCEVNSVKRNALEQIRHTNSNYFINKWGALIRELAKTDKDNKIRSAAFTVLCGWKDTLSKQLMLTAIDDSSYSVAGTALNYLHKTDTTLAYSIAKKVITTNAKGALLTEAWSIIGTKGNDTDFEYYDKNALTMIANNSAYLFFYSLSDYIVKTRGKSSFIKAINLYAQMLGYIEQKNMRSRLGIHLFSLFENEHENLSYQNKEKPSLLKNYQDEIKATLNTIINNEKEISLKESYEKRLKKIFVD